MKFRELLSKKNEEYHQHPAIHIAFLGDSITHGVFEAYRGASKRSEIIVDSESVYHAKLKRKLNMVFPSAPINILNAGISGDHAPGGLNRLDRDIIRHNPDLVIVCFGLNDSGQGVNGIDGYSEALRGIFKRLKEVNQEVIFMTPNMKNTYVSQRIQDHYFQNVAKECADNQNTGIMDAYIARARTVCGEENVPVCDVYKKWKDMHELGVDVTLLLSNYINHPTRDMHTLFADALFELIMFG